MAWGRGMKKSIKISFVVLLMVFLGLTGCDSSSDEACKSSGVNCAADNSTIQACCTNTNCRIVTGTQSFSCIGVENCTSAIDASFDFCNGASNVLSKTESDLTKMLLQEKIDNVFLKKSIDEMYIDLGNEVSQ